MNRNETIIVHEIQVDPNANATGYVCINPTFHHLQKGPFQFIVKCYLNAKYTQLICVISLLKIHIHRPTLTTILMSSFLLESYQIVSWIPGVFAPSASPQNADYGNNQTCNQQNDHHNDDRYCSR